MAAISNPTNSTAVTELINSEVIKGELAADAHRPVPVYQQIVHVLDCRGEKSPTFALPQWTGDTISDTSKTETDEFSYIEQDTTEDTVTVATAGIRKGLSFEAIDDAVIDIVAGALRNSRLDLDDQIDTDSLSVITGASNTENHSGADLTMAHVIEAAATMAGNNPHDGTYAFLGHSRQIGDLRLDLRSNGGEFVTASTGGGGGDLMQLLRKGFVGSWMGIPFYESNNVPQFDANNWSGALLKTGMGGAIVLAVKEGLQVTFKEWPERRVLDVIVSARYAASLRLDNNIVEVVSSKT